MKKTVYPFIALGLGVLLMAALMAATNTLTPDGELPIPLLPLLLMSEFGFITSAVGAVVGVMAIKQTQRKLMMCLTAFACAAMSVRFMLLGIEFWPL